MTDFPLLVLAIIFVSAFIRSAVGFGDALRAMPLLTMSVGLQTATPLVALLGLTMAAAILLSGWRKVEFGSAWPLILGSCLGIPLGLWVLHYAPGEPVKLVLGVLLLAYGSIGLSRRPLPPIHSDRPALAFGFLAGVLGAAYNTNGPPVVIYGTQRGWSPAHFRSTLQSYFLCTNLLIVAGHGLSGLWTQRVLTGYVQLLPVLVLGIWMGSLVNRWLPVAIFRQAVFALLILVGAMLIWNTLAA